MFNFLYTRKLIVFLMLTLRGARPLQLPHALMTFSPFVRMQQALATRTVGRTSHAHNYQIKLFALI